MKLYGDASRFRNDADGHFRRNTIVYASGVCTASMSVYCARRNDVTPCGGQMMRS